MSVSVHVSPVRDSLMCEQTTPGSCHHSWAWPLMTRLPCPVGHISLCRSANNSLMPFCEAFCHKEEGDTQWVTFMGQEVKLFLHVENVCACLGLIPDYFCCSSVQMDLLYSIRRWSKIVESMYCCSKANCIDYRIRKGTVNCRQVN